MRSTHDRFLRLDGAVDYLESTFNYPIGPKYLERLRYLGGGPTYCKIGKYCVYRPEDLDEWVKSRTREVRSTSQVA